MREDIEYYVMWGFKTAEEVEAVRDEMVEEDLCVCSFGSGDKQYMGFDASEGKITVHEPTDELPIYVLEWRSDLQEETPDYWMSPMEIETPGAVPVDEKGQPTGGEAFDWGSNIE